MVNFFTLAKVTQVKGIELESVNSEQQTFSLILERLEEIEPKYKISSYHHALSYMEKYPNTCIRNLVKNPEREKLFIFSQPQTLYLGARVYLNPELSSKVNYQKNKSDKINLVQFIKDNPNYILGIEHERSYGETLDQQIQLIPSKNKYLMSGSSNELVLVMMLYNNKIDFIIEYPDVMYNASKFSSASPLTSYGIASGDKFQFGYLACSNTKQGRDIINQFNSALTNSYQEPSYYKAHTDWIDQSSHQTFKQLYQELILNN
ncbi:hypothetical protein GCM10011501_24990 [Thalassotalea profundi]|uniref:Solute-binding protein family 3/N-terminal domain-containing protein n=1 Tax=Thalassotalea profundi TaxID=2036687 RepID=A0ABQ3IW57_9GAMM|nr:hypothetical protein GCM10011501_24990 [Thalassotalea profundi]